MSNKQTEALKLALEDLLLVWPDRPSITAIREALADHTEQPLEMVAEQPSPPAWWPAVENIFKEYGLQAVDFVADFKQALAEQPAQQQGWKLVPVQPTDEMRDAGNAIIGDRGALFAAYRAMLNAAPQPAQQEPVITKNEKGLTLHVGWDDLPAGTKLYTSPPVSKPWVGLSTNDLDEIDAPIREKGHATIAEIYRAIEAKLREKNTGETK